ncbi:alpha/beta hydrolase [Pseudomonas sichuanensis]|uniref:alpha/beta hydrolase n=1 Tax=Pseudomonas TaxID=286 RepID=UPI0036E6148A
MALHPDLADFLELAEFGRLSGKTRPMHELGVERAREDFEQASAVLDLSPPGQLQVVPLRITARDGHGLDARLYRSEYDGGALRPVILYLHGGGYVVGSLDSHDSVCRRLANSGDFVVLACDYRRAPEHVFPTALHDCLDSANWLAEHAGQWGADAGRAVFAGDSVGATLATVMALIAQRQPADIALRPRAQALFYPVADAACQRPSHSRYAQGYLLESATLEWFYAQYCVAPEQRLDWRVSPLRIEALAAQVPTWLAVAGYDPLRDEGVAYAELLRGAGTELAYSLEEGLTHDFLRMSGMVDRVGQIYQEVNAWMLRQVG